MKVHVYDIPEIGVEIEPQHPQDEWFYELMSEVFGSELRQATEATALIRLDRTEKNVTLSGQVTAPLQLTCDRCLEPFQEACTIEMLEYLIPAVQNDGRHHEEDEIMLDEADLAFSTYSDQTLDLKELIREPLVLGLPLRHFCQDDCQGLCVQCGSNLNHSACQCKPDDSANPFAVLKTLKK